MAAANADDFTHIIVCQAAGQGEPLDPPPPVCKGAQDVEAR